MKPQTSALTRFAKHPVGSAVVGGAALVTGSALLGPLLTPLGEKVAGWVYGKPKTGAAPEPANQAAAETGGTPDVGKTRVTVDQDQVRATTETIWNSTVGPFAAAFGRMMGQGGGGQAAPAAAYNRVDPPEPPPQRERAKPAKKMTCACETAGASAGGCACNQTGAAAETGAAHGHTETGNADDVLAFADLDVDDLGDRGDLGDLGDDEIAAWALGMKMINTGAAIDVGVIPEIVTSIIQQGEIDEAKGGQRRLKARANKLEKKLRATQADVKAAQAKLDKQQQLFQAEMKKLAASDKEGRRRLEKRIEALQRIKIKLPYIPRPAVQQIAKEPVAPSGFQGALEKMAIDLLQKQMNPPVPVQMPPWYPYAFPPMMPGAPGYMPQGYPQQGAPQGYPQQGAPQGSPTADEPAPPEPEAEDPFAMLDDMDPGEMVEDIARSYANMTSGVGGTKRTAATGGTRPKKPTSTGNAEDFANLEAGMDALDAMDDLSGGFGEAEAENDESGASDFGAGLDFAADLAGGSDLRAGLDGLDDLAGDAFGDAAFGGDELGAGDGDGLDDLGNYEMGSWSDPSAKFQS